MGKDGSMRTKALYRFVDFVRPDSHWPYPYTLEQAFGVLSWMLDTGEPYCDPTRWGHQSILSLLSGKPTLVNFSAMDPIISIDDLCRRFHYALLSSYVGPRIKKWREDHDIRVGGEKVIAFRHHTFGGSGTSEAEVERGIRAFLGAEGVLTTSLNDFHKEAVEIYGVQLRHFRKSLGIGSWSFELQYGFDGSVWRHELARQSRKESFLAAFRRAKEELGKLTAPVTRRGSA